MAANHNSWNENGGAGDGTRVGDELRGLIAELDRPLMAGFMTAGYGALGRYIFLAAEARDAEASRPARS